MRTLYILFLPVSILVCCQAQEPDFIWQQFRDSLTTLERDSLYRHAMHVLQANKNRFETRWFEVSKEEIYLNEKLGNLEANLSLFRTAHQKGYFYLIHPNLPQYKPYLEVPGFSDISKRDLELRDQANSTSKMLFDVVHPKNFSWQKSYPVLLIFHGGGSNLERLKKHWHHRELENNYLRIYVQNYLHYDSETYGWRTGDERAFKKLAYLFSEVEKTYHLDQRQILVAGMSAGGTFAIDVAVRQVLPIRGFLTFCPGMPGILGAEHPQEPGDLSIKGFIISGEHDYYLKKQQQMLKLFKKKGIPCKQAIIKDVGHEYPPNEATWIGEALKFL